MRLGPILYRLTAGAVPLKLGGKFVPKGDAARGLCWAGWRECIGNRVVRRRNARTRCKGAGIGSYP